MSASVSLQCVELAGVDPEWDRYLEEVGADIVQTSMWGVSKRAIGQTPFLITARDAEGRIVGGALLISRSVGFGLRLAYVAGGPVVRSAKPELWRETLKACLQTAKGSRCQGMIVQLPANQPEGDTALDALRPMPSLVSVSPAATLTIDLQASDEALLAAMSASRRRHVRRSIGQDIEVEFSDDIAAFHALHSATAGRKGFTQQYLEAQWNALRPFNAVQIVVAKHAGRPLEASWITVFAGKATFRLSGWDPGAAGDLRVNEALKWGQIRQLRDAGVKTCDLGGIDRSIAEDMLAGRPLDRKFEKSPASFKLGFSKNVVLLGQPKLRVTGSRRAGSTRHGTRR